MVSWGSHDRRWRTVVVGGAGGYVVAPEKRERLLETRAEVPPQVDPYGTTDTVAATVSPVPPPAISSRASTHAAFLALTSATVAGVVGALVGLSWPGRYLYGAVLVLTVVSIVLLLTPLVLRRARRSGRDGGGAVRLSAAGVRTAWIASLTAVVLVVEVLLGDPWAFLVIFVVSAVTILEYRPRVRSRERRRAPTTTTRGGPR